VMIVITAKQKAPLDQFDAELFLFVFKK